MAKSDADKMSRVQLMASGSETWDLSRNDIAALKYVLALVATLRTRAEAAEAAAAVEVAETREWRTALLRCVAVADQGARTWVENPSALVAFVAETIVGLRERVEAAEAAHARHAADRSREVTDLHRAHERALRRAEQAEAEVARLRGELDGTRPKGWRDIVRNAALADVTRCITTLSVDVPADVAPIVQLVADQIVAAQRAGYEAALREAAGVLRDAAKKHRGEAEASRSVAASGGHVLAADILESYANLIDLLDAAPAAEGE